MQSQLFNDRIPIKDNRAETVFNYIVKELIDVAVLSEREVVAFILLEEICGIKKNTFHLSKDLRLTESEIIKISKAIARLINHEPIDYIIGHTPFYFQSFIVSPDVLIPRPETEELVDIIIKENKYLVNQPRILDIGTGSGCIAISLAKNFPSDNVVAIDISINAIQIAQQNAYRLQTNVSFEQVNFLEIEHRKNLQNFNIIVSNPPYIALNEKDSLSPNILNYEPHQALFVPDDNPLVFYDAIAKFGITNLLPQGVIYVEINQELGTQTFNLFQSYGYSNVKLFKDLSGNDRFIKADL